MVRRYEYNECVRDMLENEDGTGRYVTYSDYKAAEGNYKKNLARLNVKIKQLEKELEHYEGDDSCVFEVDFGDERN